MKQKKERGQGTPRRRCLTQIKQRLPQTCSLTWSSSVSGRLLQCNIVTCEEHGVFVNPGAKYEDLLIAIILDEIGTSIKIDKRKFNTFLDEVLEEIGGPAEDIAGRMSR